MSMSQIPIGLCHPKESCKLAGRFSALGLTSRCGATALCCHSRAEKRHIISDSSTN